MARAGTKVGTGYVEIRPDFTGFQDAVERAVKQRFAKIGDQAGRTLSEGINKRVRQDRDGFGLASALAPLTRRFQKAGDDAGRAIADRIGRGTRSAKGDMFGLAGAIGEVEKRSRAASGAAKRLERDMFGVQHAARGRSLLSASAQLRDWHRGAIRASVGGRRLSERLRSVSSELRAASRNARTGSSGFGGFDGTMARLNRSFSFFRNLIRTIKWPVFVAGLGLALQGLSALAAGAVALTSSLGPLAGALIALPAAALAAAQAFGVLKLATSGIGDAVKAALDAEVQGGSQAADVMRQQEEAAERVADAKRNLTDVQRQAKIAQEDLTQAREDARRELEDMELAAKRSRDSEQEAVLQLREARAELRRIMRDPSASGLDIRFAEEAIDQARHDLEQTRIDARRARQDYRDAQRAGVEGMPQVVAAKRAVKDATQAEEDARRDLSKAIRDNTAAMQEQGAAATTLQQKMSQLPKAAQEFVRELVGLKPRLDDLRETAASGFFPGATKGLHSLLGNFGEVRTVVGETSEMFGRLAARAGKKFGSDIWGKDLLRIGRLNTKVLDRMGDAGLNLADAFRHILVSARPFLNWLSKGIVDLSEWVKGEAAAGRESGRLAEFFDRTRESMELLGPILKGVGGALLNIGEAARPLGNEILKALGGSAEGWRKWTDSIAGRNDLKQYFAEAKPAIFEMGKLIGAAGKAFFELGRQSGVAHLLRLVRTELIPALTDMTGAITGWASDFLREFGLLRNRGVPTFEAFVRVLINHAGQAGLAIAKALLKGFVNAGIWGKLAVGAFLFSKLGGTKAAALGAGKAIGRWLGIGISASAASALAGGAAAGAGGGAAAGAAGGGILAGLKKVKWARVGGLGIGLALADGIFGEFDRRAKMRSDDLQEALLGISESQLGKGSFLGDKDLFGIQVFQSDEGAKAENLLAQYQELLQTRVKLSSATIESLRTQARELDLTKRQRAQMDRMFASIDAARRFGLQRFDLGIDPAKLAEISRNFSFLRSGVLSSMRDINTVTRRNMNIIASQMGLKSADGRRAVAQNFRSAAMGIKEGILRGEINARVGMRRIADLLRNARLISGEDPFRIARGFADSWRRAGGINRNMQQRMLADMQKMPAAARQRAFDAMLAYGRGLVEAGKIPLKDLRDFRSRALSEFDTLKVKGKASSLDLAIGIARNFGSMGGAVANVLSIFKQNTNNALVKMGVRKLDFVIDKVGGWLGFGGGDQRRQRGGEVRGFATGGLASIVPGQSTGDRHTLSINGVPVAKVESREGIFVGNRNLMAVMQRANDAVPRFQRGGFAGVSGDTDFVPALGFALSKMARATGNSIFVQDGRRTMAEQAALYAAYKNGTGNLAAAPNRNAPHVRGIAGDITPGREAFGGVADKFGMGFTVPSESWHIELLNAALGAMGAGAAFAPKLARVLLEGASGPLKTLGQGAIDKVHSAAQKYLDSHASFGGFGGAGGGPWKQVMQQIAQSRGWDFGAWWELVMRESGGNPEAVNPSSGAFGLGQFLGSTAQAYARYGALSHDPSMQIKAMAKYIADRYGSPTGALAFHDAHNWYKQGGLLKLPGLQRGGAPFVHAARLTKRKGIGPLPEIARSLKTLRAFGLGPRILSRLGSLSDDVERHTEFASNAGALTFENAEGETILGTFQGATEEHWLGRTLEDLLDLRNVLLRAREAILEQREAVAARIKQAFERVKHIKEELREGRELRESLTSRLSRVRNFIEQATSEQAKSALREQARGLLERIGILDMRQGERRNLLQQFTGKVIPGLKGEQTELGTTIDEIFSESGDKWLGLTSVQGLSGPLNIITSTPPIGLLGGQILNVQSQLRALGLHQPSVSADDEALELQKEENRLLKLRLAIRDWQAPILDNLPGVGSGFQLGGEVLPFGGTFHGGGIAPGSPTRESMVKVTGGEGIFTPEQLAAMGGDGGSISDHSVMVNVYEGEGRAEVFIDEKKIEAVVKRITRGQARSAARGIQPAGVLRR